MTRLNWGCGPRPASGWMNSDRESVPGVDLVCDIRDGIPLGDDSVDYIVSIHALQDLSYFDIVGALEELRRVLKPDGVLRLGLPDLDRAIQAYVRGERRYFYIPDDEAMSLGGKLCIQAIWYGSTRTPFTFDFTEELLARAKFHDVCRCAFRQTTSPWPDIIELDNRERESFFVEARK